MPTTVQDVMSTELVTCPSNATLQDVAQKMRDHDIGDVLITDGSTLAGIVTDRDLVVRCLAGGANAGDPASNACSAQLTTVPFDADVEDAADLMRSHAVRRLPVLDAGRAVGIVSLGDLAMNREPHSVLGEVSGAVPNS